MSRNAVLEEENQRLKYQLRRLEVDSLTWQRLSTDSVIRPFPYQYKVAQVVGTTLFGGKNYLTIDTVSYTHLLLAKSRYPPSDTASSIERVVWISRLPHSSPKPDSSISSLSP